MTGSLYIAIACLLLLFFTAACSNPVQNSGGESATRPIASPTAQKITSESVVKVATPPVEVSAGGAAEAIVRVTIQIGYHVNANPPTFSYLKATQLDISPGEGISAARVSYPMPVTKKFAFAEKPLAVYEGETEIKATIKADATASKGEHSVAAQLRVQACDDQVCYPPGQIELRLPVMVK